MLLKLAALLAAISHTYHDTVQELKQDAAEEKAGMTQYMLDAADTAHRNRRDAVLEGHESRREQADELYNAAHSARVKADKAANIINIVKGTV